MRTQSEMALGEILDRDWVRSQFHSPMTTSEEEKHRIMTLRYQTTANTSLGGSGIGNSRVLNPPPGINRFADTPRGFGSDGVTEGNGVYHHEFLEKPMDIVHIRPGVPRFNPLTDFWTNSFNPDVMEAVEYGWIRKAANFVGELLGFVVTAPLMVVGGIFKTLRSLVLGPNANKYNFYYLSPAPFLFWKGLDDMMTTLAVKIGFTGSARFSDTKIASEGTYAAGLPNEQTDTMKEIMRLMPGVMDELDMTGGHRLDTITLAHRYNMMYEMRSDYLKAKSQELLGTTFSSDKEYYNAIAQWEEALLADPEAYMGGESIGVKLTNARKILQDINKFQSDDDRYRNIMGSVDWKGDDQVRKANQSQVISDDGTVSVTEEAEQAIVDFTPPSSNIEYGAGGTDFVDKYKSVAMGGLDFFSLAVDKIESGSISINNNVGPSSIESMFNGTVSSAKNAWFSASNGNISDGAIGGAIEGVAQTGKAFINGLANNITGGIQSALFGGKAFIDISDVYQGSTTSMPTITYNFTSQAISAHPISKLKMFFPVMAILRCASPISAGARSFMSPFLVALTQKGRNVCNMGLITDVNIDWGGEAGWDVNDIPCELKVSFTVTNLDKNFHVPLNSDMTDVFNDEGQYEALMNTIAGVSPTDLDRSWAYSIKTNWARKVAAADRFFSSSYMATSLGAGTRSMFEGPISALGGYVQWRE